MSAPYQEGLIIVSEYLSLSSRAFNNGMTSRNSPDSLNALEDGCARPWFHEVHVSRPQIGMVKAYAPRVVGFLVLLFGSLRSPSRTD